MGVPENWLSDLWEAAKVEGFATMVLLFIVVVLITMLITERKRGHEAWKQLVSLSTKQTEASTRLNTLIENFLREER